MFAGTQSLIRNTGCKLRLRKANGKHITAKLEHTATPKLCSGYQANPTAQHRGSRGYTVTSNLARSSRGGLSIQAKMGQQGDKRYPPGIQDVGFSLLRAPKLLLTNAERARLDESPDSPFYETPRLMQHVSTQFIERLQGVYSTLLPLGASALELCASRHSHLPPGLELGQLVGQGMNTTELSQNPDLTQWFVQDFNQQPLLLEQLDASYDAVLCVNGIQYLTQPETVITEAWRVLRPGGFLLIAFGCHFFPEKAIAGWTGRSTEQRTALLSAMLKANGFDQVLVMDAAATTSSTGTGGKDAISGAAGQQSHAAQTAAADGIQVLVATKPSVPLFSTAAAATASSGGDLSTVGATDMRPDNVATWFTKPGLAGLSASVSGAASGSAAASKPQVSSQHADVDGAPHTGNSYGQTSGEDADPSLMAGPQRVPDVSDGFSHERLVEQWRASYGVLASDAVALGIPESVIPQLKEDASPTDVQAAVQHLQAMVASFLSSGL